MLAAFGCFAFRDDATAETPTKTNAPVKTVALCQRFMTAANSSIGLWLTQESFRRLINFRNFSLQSRVAVLLGVYSSSK